MRWFWQREKKPKRVATIPEGAIRRRLHYTGDVQAVGFRFTAQGWADQCGVTGWVLNRSDGDVQLEVQGTPSQVRAFMDAVDTESAREGAFIHAHLVESEAIEPKPEDSFTIKNLYF